MKKDYEQETLVGLFEKISLCGKMYAQEAAGLDPFSSGKMDELPEAMLYRARVIEQYTTEIKERAYNLQQQKYDSLTDREKIKYHEDQVVRGENLMDHEEDYSVWNTHVQPHLHQMLIIESYKEEYKNLPENKYKFGDK